jgi:hypothetical protein
MRHVTLTCKNHPDLRWSCKEIAVNRQGQYNGARSIFYNGRLRTDGGKGYEYVTECPCPPTDLIFAPEELERQKTEPIDFDAPI